MIHKNYSWRLLTYSQDANEVGAELEQIEETNGLTPENVVEYAKNKDTVLNSMFDWNDESAGQKYRIIQARTIINHIQVEIVNKEERKPIRAFVKTSTKKEDSYRNIESVVTDAEKYDMLLTMAYKELNQTKNKYKALTEIQELLKDIPEVL